MESFADFSFGSMQVYRIIVLLMVIIYAIQA